jgi:hypothetical protein
MNIFQNLEKKIVELVWHSTALFFHFLTRRALAGSTNRRVQLCRLVVIGVAGFQIFLVSPTVIVPFLERKPLCVVSL